jgi:hypothetical protein
MVANPPRFPGRLTPPGRGAQLADGPEPLPPSAAPRQVGVG